jgi:hypothetical protein
MATKNSILKTKAAVYLVGGAVALGATAGVSEGARVYAKLLRSETTYTESVGPMHAVAVSGNMGSNSDAALASGVKYGARTGIIATAGALALGGSLIFLVRKKDSSEGEGGAQNSPNVH